MASVSSPQLHPRSNPPTGTASGGNAARVAGARVPLDAIAVPALLLLIAGDLLLHDPPRVLAWRLLHEPGLLARAGWLAALLSELPAQPDQDPLGLLLGLAAGGLAVLYLLVALCGGRARLRAALLALGSLLVVVGPTLGFVVTGAIAERPYGQDGGVVQLPLALDKILAGQSPYGADYSDSILGKQARVSAFWAAHGGNPILHHHAYLPGTHLLMLPFHVVCRALFGSFDPRLVTLLGYLLAIWLATRLVEGDERRLCAAAAVAINPLVYWQQVFGANDVLVAALLLGALLLAVRGRDLGASLLLGLACATKQLAWPFAPFLLLYLARVSDWRQLRSRAAVRAIARFTAAALGVFALVVTPLLLLDPRAFWGDIVVYNVGLAGGDSYPLGGTPGFGAANFLIYFGRVASLREHVSFGPAYALLLPLGLWLAWRQLRESAAWTVPVMGSVALLLSLYFSRVVHPNYLILAAILLPVGMLMGARLAPDVALTPLLLLALAVEIAEHELLRGVWQDALSVRLPDFASGAWRWLLPRAGPGLTEDPMGLLVSASCAGLALLLLVAGVLGVGARWRAALLGLALLAGVIAPTAFVVHVGRVTGSPRFQDPWLASVWQHAGGAAAAPLQLWSESFSSGPPQAVETHPLHGAEWVLTWLDARDLRGLMLLVLAVVVALLARRPGALLLTALGVLVSTSAAIGVLAGSSDLLLLVPLLVAVQVRRTGLGLALLALCALLLPRALFAAPALLLASGPWGGVLGAALWLLPGLAPAASGELGLRNVWSPAAGWWLPCLLIGAATLAAHRAPSQSRLPWAAAFLLLGWWGTAASPLALTAPLVLLVASATLPEDRFLG